MPYEIKVCLEEHTKFHNQALDYLFLSWKEKDPIEKEILELRYKQFSKKAEKMAEKIEYYTKIYMKEKYGNE